MVSSSLHESLPIRSLKVGTRTLNGLRTCVHCQIRTSRGELKNFMRRGRTAQLLSARPYSLTLGFPR